MSLLQTFKIQMNRPLTSSGTQVDFVQVKIRPFPVGGWISEMPTESLQAWPLECKEGKLCEKADDINHNDRLKGLTTCKHTLRCPNCMEEHKADDTSCRMRNHAVCEERCRRKVRQGQTFISKWMETDTIQQDIEL